MTINKTKIKKILLKIGMPILLISIILKGLPWITNFFISNSAVNFLKQNKVSISKTVSSELNFVTANVQNGRNGLEESVTKLADLFTEDSKNVYCLQESTKEYVEILLDKLSDDYTAHGDYRLFDIDYEYNEGNPIITNAIVKDAITFRLSFIPDNLIDLGISIKDISIMPRIAVLALMETEQGEHFLCLNTHLDYNIPSLQKQQLKEIHTILSEIPTDYPIVIAGDFNIVATDNRFIDFKNQLEDLGIIEVENNENTYKGNETEPGKRIDYLFSRGISLDSQLVITTPEESDHNFLLGRTR